MVQEMQILRVSFLGLFLLFCGTPPTTEAPNGFDSYYLDDPSERYWISSSYLVKRFGEKTFRGTHPIGGEFTATALVVALSGDYNEVVSHLSELLEESFGIDRLRTMRDVDISDAWSYHPHADTASILLEEKREWSSSLDELKISRTHVETTFFRTKRYNEVGSRSGYSQARFVALNGRQLFDCKCTIILVYRLDKAKQWGLDTMHNLSFGYRLRVIEIVTETELDILESLASGFDHGIQMVKVVSARTWYDDVELWKGLRSSCSSSGEQ